MKRQLFFIAFSFIFLSRLFILFNPPQNYSDVFQDYRRYAQMWASGLTPYLKHLYEYPPGTIPLIYFPEILNQKNIGHYVENYRVQIFIFDLVISWLILRQIFYLKSKQISKIIAVAFLTVAPIIAKDFFYDGIDSIFAGIMALSIIYWSKPLFSWVLFWLAAAIKLLNIPLFLIWVKKDWKLLLLGFILVWGVPLFLFRSSLSVVYIYNNARGIKYAAFPDFVVETINNFTQTEVRRNEPPDFELRGPISSTANRAVAIVYPLSLLLVVAYGRFRVADTYAGRIKITLVYFLTMFFTAKIFSQPFHIWYISLLALYPFKSIKLQASMLGLAIMLLIVDTTPWIRYPAEYKFYAYLFLRYVPLASLLWLSLKLPSR